MEGDLGCKVCALGQPFEPHLRENLPSVQLARPLQPPTFQFLGSVTDTFLNLSEPQLSSSESYLRMK